MASARPSGGSRGILIQVMWFLPGLYVLVLVFHGEGFEPLVDGLFGLAVQWLPAAGVLAGCVQSPGP